MNYTQLQTQVASYLHRTDLASQIPTFIELAEAYLFRELHIKEMEVSVAGTTTSGYADLPTDFGSVSRVSVTYGGSARALDYISLADAPTATTSAPAYYSLENNKLRIWGASDGQAYTLYYIPAIQNLSGSVSTNWLLENAPELYLDAACLQGAKYTRNDAEVAKLTQNVTMSVDSVKRFSERRGHPATGSMQIKVRRG
jgi:hypothetical protein